MKPDDLKNWILSLTQDITFVYRGISGSICPFTRQNISLAYGDRVHDFDSADAVMDARFFNGKSLAEISEEVDFD